MEKHNHSVGGYLDFGQISLPYISGNIQYDVAILTEITLFKGHKLKEYESDLTLPTKMHEASPAVSQTNYQLIYQLGNYPKFELNLK
ncbi:hypothetical protein [Marinicellulosiphila megalodicopiae]|uniref:hypothetical protein n=1 Tax=Marinicellulosiphila megalodicopiae TaxID=2724896 RepID=UPI003BB0E685